VEGSLLLVNHNLPQLEGWKIRLRDWGVSFKHTRDSFAALQMLHVEKIVGIVCREDLPILSGRELSQRAKREDPGMVVQVLQPPAGGIGEESWKHGEISFREGGFIRAVGTILLASGMLLDKDRFGRLLAASKRYPEIIGQSPAIREVFALMDKVKDQDVTVLIRGESGTGKELVAAAIHRCGCRAGRQFVSVNCAAIPETLLESELFGHEKGAYTGADSRVMGRVEQADGGCLFLEEIGDMSFKTQAKILRLLEGHEFERLGGREKIRVDVRILAATNRDLEEAVREDLFREDLYYRIGAFPIFLPPLRSRLEDIPLLVAGILEKFNRNSKKPVTAMTPRGLSNLYAYDWPGNVRQLENTVRRAAIMTGGGVITERDISITTGEVPPVESMETIEVNDEKTEEASTAGIRSLRDVEMEAIAQALKATDGNISRSARELGISRATLYKKIKNYGLKGEKPTDEEFGDNKSGSLTGVLDGDIQI